MKINLNNIQLENIGQWPVFIKISMLLVNSILIIFLGYWLKIQEPGMMLNRLQTQELVLKKEFENKQQRLYPFNEYNQQIQILNNYLTSLLKQFSAPQDIPLLLEEISQLGISSGLKFELFAPQKEVFQDFYVELPIRISVVGSYFQFAIFLSRVSNIDHIVTIDELEIKRLFVNNLMTAPVDQLVMNITAKVYRCFE